MNTIEVINATKVIKGEVVLSEVNLRLVSGKVYGFIGINGSGKTMLLRLLSGLMKPTSGEVVINGRKLYSDIKNVGNLGIVLENKGLNIDLTGRENLTYLSKIAGSYNKSMIDNAITRIGLDPCEKKILKKYSLGMKQKIVLAQAIMNKPDFLFLDEPTNALDEGSIVLFRKIVKEEKERGALILLASHNKDDIESLCDVVYNMQKGKLISSE